MSIEHITSKIKREEHGTGKSPFLSLDNNTFVIIVIILVAFVSFGMGRLSTISAQEKTPIVFSEKLPVSSENKPDSSQQEQQGAATNSLKTNSLKSGSIVASKNGTKYHFPWCSGAQQMKEENKIWFNNEQEARKAGYEPASNCKGLK